MEQSHRYFTLQVLYRDEVKGLESSKYRKRKMNDFVTEWDEKHVGI